MTQLAVHDGQPARRCYQTIHKRARSRQRSPRLATLPAPHLRPSAGPILTRPQGLARTLRPHTQASSVLSHPRPHRRPLVFLNCRRSPARQGGQGDPW
ncbi:uncharacterized protein B0H18DRAFT_1041392 [Fomitopsis serialis]|uniref:uncharacterized protein n=1 Tax=Fomitopsis serialis TaxID=139415 RepID=UPI002008CB7A|nr:uncharacterized protein B0H18DRAFT_1041392 [Neoantrodia serialis]KAH9915544.1 hypothetical protein B0H18DRAFT_1041392 [Neoantrodia serialis]